MQNAIWQYLSMQMNFNNSHWVDILQLSYEVKSKLESFKVHGNNLLIRVQEAEYGRLNSFTETSHDLFSRSAGTLAKNIFGSSSFGGMARKATRAYLKQQQREQKAILERGFESEFLTWYASIKTLVETISIETRGMSKPNTDRLIDKLTREKQFIRLETRISHVLSFINQLLNEKIICNSNISNKPLCARNEILIEPATPFSSHQKLKEILKNVNTYVKVLDAYVDDSTLEILLQVPKEASIQLLTEYTGGDKEKSFISSCKRFAVERALFQIRKCEKGLLHDRFIITKDKGYSIGSSLKDLGKRTSSIIEIDDKAKFEEQFDKMWKVSKHLW